MSPGKDPLETQLDRQLKALPELTAPEGLTERVMAAIRAQEKLPWFQRSWQTWPTALRYASLLALLTLFGGLCYGGWQASHFTSAAVGKKYAAELLSLTTVWNAVNSVVSAAVLAFHQVNTGVLIGFCAALALGYAMVVALGTVYVRIGFSKR
jgi:hypothetical protein